MKAKQGLRNILANFVSQFITLAFGIVIPRLVLVNLGSESNGLLNSIGQVLAYIALLEAGVGAASLQALYKPIAKDDHISVRRILAATDHFYKRTGRMYFAVILGLTFVFPITIQTSLPKRSVMWVVFLSGMPGVVSYYFQGKFQILLQAEGKSYILTSLTTVIHLFTNITKIILLLCKFDIVVLQAMYLLYDLVKTAVIVIYIKRHYKWLDLSIEPDYAAISQSKNALIHQVSTFVFHNTDVLILTYFCGLGTVSIYSMYTLLFGMISNVINHFSGVGFILGQTFHTDRKKYIQLNDVYELFNMTLTFSLFCIGNIFILPFMKLYTSGVTDVNYLDCYLPYLFIATYLLSCGRSSSLQTINRAQHFKQTQWRSIFESVINLTVSLACVSKFGIYGVLMGTIAALLYRTNDMILYANKKILNRNPWITYRRWLLNLALFIAITIGAKYIFSFIALDSYLKIIFWAIICCVVIIPIFFVTVSLFDREVYRYAKALVMPYLKAFLGKFRRKGASA